MNEMWSQSFQLQENALNMVPKINQVNLPHSHSKIMFREFNEVVCVSSIIKRNFRETVYFEL